MEKKNKNILSEMRVRKRRTKKRNTVFETLFKSITAMIDIIGTTENT